MKEQQVSCLLLYFYNGGSGAEGNSESYFEVSHKCLEIVLSRQASVAEISVDIAPFLQSAIVKQP